MSLRKVCCDWLRTEAGAPGADEPSSSLSAPKKRGLTQGHCGIVGAGAAGAAAAGSGGACSCESWEASLTPKCLAHCRARARSCVVCQQFLSLHAAAGPTAGAGPTVGSTSTGVLLGGAELGRWTRSARGARGTGGRRGSVWRGLGAGGGGRCLLTGAVRGTGLAVRGGSASWDTGGGQPGSVVSVVSAEASDGGPSLRSRVSSLSLGIFWCSRTHQGVPAALAAAAATAAAATFDAQPCGLPTEKHVLLFDQTGASDLCVLAFFASCPFADESPWDSASVSGSASGSALGSSQWWRFSATFSFASAVGGVPGSAAVAAVAGPRPLLLPLAPALLGLGLGGRVAHGGPVGSVGPVGSGRIAAWSVRTGGALLGLGLALTALSAEVAVSASAGELARGVCEVLRLAARGAADGDAGDAGVGVAPLAGVGTLGHRPMGLPRTSKR